MNLPQGFRCAGVASGIKKSNKPDVAFIVTQQSAVAAGVYTQNIVRAASIDWNAVITPTNDVRAIVVNSGNANACTGDLGKSNNEKIAALAATQIGVDPKNVLVLSTGVIGVQLPMENVEAGIASAAGALGDTPQDFELAAQAITTTDKSTKTVGVAVELGGEKIQISGMAKGAGMIGPRMATMLGVIMTDANITQGIAQEILTAANAVSFNQISVEGHTSTNDALLLVASGQTGDPITDPQDIEALTLAITDVCVELAKMIPADGEGASHLIQIDVEGARDDQQADIVARTVASSALVKTAVAGSDPNWGRIVSAVGYSGVDLEANEISLKLNGIQLFKSGQPVAFDQTQVSQLMSSQFETLIELSIGNGSGKARHWTSDLTVDYVRFNSEYTT